MGRSQEQAMNDSSKPADVGYESAMPFGYVDEEPDAPLYSPANLIEWALMVIVGGAVTVIAAHLLLTLWPLIRWAMA